MSVRVSTVTRLTVELEGRSRVAHVITVAHDKVVHAEASDGRETPEYIDERRGTLEFHTNTHARVRGLEQKLTREHNVTQVIVHNRPPSHGGHTATPPSHAHHRSIRRGLSLGSRRVGTPRGGPHGRSWDRARRTKRGAGVPAITSGASHGLATGDRITMRDRATAGELDRRAARLFFSYRVGDCGVDAGAGAGAALGARANGDRPPFAFAAPGRE